MAREAKPAPKKTSTTKTAKTPAKKARVAKKSTHSNHYQTLRLSQADRSFLSAQLTHQTIYWVVIGVLVIAFGSWIMYLQVTINDMYNKIEETQEVQDATPQPARVMQSQ